MSCGPPVALEYSAPEGVGMDRFDPRWDDDRGRSQSVDRDWGGRSGRGDHDSRGGHERSPFTRDLDLPGGDERECVRSRRGDYDLDGVDSEALATIGAFRVVQVEDLRHALEASRGGATPDQRVDRLRESGLLERIPLDGRRQDVVVLTNRGRELLEAHRLPRPGEPRQAFYAGLRKPRELSHDAQVYTAYRRAEERLRGQGGRVRRVVLDYELKRDYQRFLQERNRGRADSDGRPDRTAEEVVAWARQHDLPYFDGHVHFPDARIEYEDALRDLRHEDIEVVTPHYRGAHAATAARSGLRRYGAGLGGGGGAGRSGRARRGGLADELLG
jgi:DNA-binding MarR family transcriptional regulator